MYAPHVVFKINKKTSNLEPILSLVVVAMKSPDLKVNHSVSKDFPLEDMPTSGNSIEHPFQGHLTQPSQKHTNQHRREAGSQERAENVSGEADVSHCKSRNLHKIDKKVFQKKCHKQFSANISTYQEMTQLFNKHLHLCVDEEITYS